MIGPCAVKKPVTVVAVCKSYDLIHEMSSSSSFMSVAVAEANATVKERRSSPRLNPCQADDDSQAPSPAADVTLDPVVTTAGPEGDSLAGLRDQVTALAGTVSTLSADVASLTKALAARLGPGGETDGSGVKVKVEAVEPRGVEPVVPGGVKPRAAEPATIDLTGGKKKKDKALSKLKKVEREKTEIKAKGTKKRKVRDSEQKVNDYKGEGGSVSAPRSAVQEAARAFHAACKGASVASAGRPAADETPAWWHEISLQEVSEMMARVPAETAAKIAGSASHKGNFYAVLDREDMNRSGVFPNWLDAEYVKKSASGYGKYGTKQDCIEGALEELDTMIKHYNLICMKKLGNK